MYTAQDRPATTEKRLGINAVEANSPTENIRQLEIIIDKEIREK
jgi:hypothetical protein